MGNAETIANVANKNSRNALQRLDGLEQGVQQLVGATNNAIGQISRQLSQIAEIADAATAILGEDVVAAKVVELRKDRLQKESAQQKAQVDDLLLQGILVPAEKVGEKSLLVGRETDKEGKEVFPGRQQVLFSQVRPDLKEKLLGQAVGAAVETPAGNTFNLVEIYDITEAKPAEATETAPAAPTEAPAPAPES